MKKVTIALLIIVIVIALASIDPSILTATNYSYVCNMQDTPNRIFSGQDDTYCYYQFDTTGGGMWEVSAIAKNEVQP